MTVKRFFAATARDCLRRVKEELGPDAIVVSNKSVNGGVELTAISAEGFELMSQQLPASHAGSRPLVPPAVAVAKPMPRTPSASSSDDDYTATLAAQMHKQPAYRAWEPSAHVAATPPETPFAKALEQESLQERPRLRPLPPRSEDTPSAAAVVASLQKAAVEIAKPVVGTDSQAQVTHLMAEVQAIKGLLERQLAGFAWGEITRSSPQRAQLLGELIEAGFSGAFARKLTEEMPADMDLDAGRKWLRAAVGRRLRTLGTEDDLVDRGGVYALVGPTGVGKTTTTAKLAARCVVRYGADRLALLTTDSYRIGAHEQLRIYGRILGVPVHIVRDGDDLRHTLSDLRDKHMVLIDTVGMSQRDRMVAEQAAMLMRAGEVNRLLLLNATSRGDTLDDVIRSYAGEDLAGCILSKVDEAASLAPAIDAVIRHGLLLAYVANGQRVPEDMHLPNRNYLLHRAFKTPAEGTPHALRDDEIGLSMTSVRNGGLLVPRGAKLG